MKGYLLVAVVLVTWLLSAVYFMFLTGILHSWWVLLPTMGFHTSLEVSAVIVVATFIGKFIGGVATEMYKGLK